MSRLFIYISLKLFVGAHLILGLGLDNPGLEELFDLGDVKLFRSLVWLCPSSIDPWRPNVSSYMIHYLNTVSKRLSL